MKFKCKYCGNIIRQDSEAPVEWCPYCHSRLIFNGTNEEGENIYREKPGKCPYCGKYVTFAAYANEMVCPDCNRLIRYEEARQSFISEAARAYSSSKICKVCGKPITDAAYICPNCGAKTPRGILEDTSAANTQKGRTYGVIGFILAFIMPLVGLILCSSSLKYLSYKDRGLSKAGIIISVIVMIAIIISFFTVIL